MRRLRFASLALVLLGIIAGLVQLPQAAGAGDVELVSTSGTPTSEMVDLYEQHSPFRGINNSNLPVTAGAVQLGDVTVELPGDGVGVARDGYIDYGFSPEGHGVIASSDGSAMDRFAVILNGPQDPTTISFNANVPPGSTISHDADTGEIVIATPAGKITTLAPALAVDAAGEKVPASYTLTDTTLTLTVDTTDATFPVIADPHEAYRWWGIMSWYSRAEVRAYADWWGVAKLTKKACGGNWVCKQTVGRYVNWVYNTAIGGPAQAPDPAIEVSPWSARRRTLP